MQGDNSRFPPYLRDPVGVHTSIEHVKQPLERSWADVLDLLAHNVVMSGCFVAFNLFDSTTWIIHTEGSREVLKLDDYFQPPQEPFYSHHIERMDNGGRLRFLSGRIQRQSSEDDVRLSRLLQQVSCLVLYDTLQHRLLPAVK